MSKLHLNWDGNQNNGIIFNDKYTWGALYKGIEFKPKLSVDYYMVQYSEVFPDNYIIYEEGGNKEALPAVISSELKAMADKWIQHPEQEGGTKWLAEKKLAEERYKELMKEFNEFLASKGKKLEASNHGVYIGDL